MDDAGASSLSQENSFYGVEMKGYDASTDVEFVPGDDRRKEPEVLENPGLAAVTMMLRHLLIRWRSAWKIKS